MIDVIKPIDFKEALWLRRWCSATSNRWCQMRVRLDGRDGGLVESEAFWIHVSSETQGPARIDDDFLATVASTTDVGRLRWKPYNKPGSRDTATDIRDFPVRFTDMDLFDHMNNSVYWSIVEDHLSRGIRDPVRAVPGMPRARLRGFAGDKLEIITNVYEDGTEFGVPGRGVTTLTYVVGDEVKALASIFAR